MANVSADLVEQFGHNGLRARTGLRTLENDGVSAQDWNQNGSDCEHDRRVPRCDSESAAPKVSIILLDGQAGLTSHLWLDAAPYSRPQASSLEASHLAASESSRTS